MKQQNDFVYDIYNAPASNPSQPLFISYSSSIHGITILTIDQIRHLGIAILLRLRLVRLISFTLSILLGTLLRSSLLLRLENGLALLLDLVVVPLWDISI